MLKKFRWNFFELRAGVKSADESPFPRILHMKRTGPTNTKTRELIAALQRQGAEQQAAIWKQVAHELAKSTRARREVNLLTLNRYTKENDVVLIPGKLLGNGELDHKLTIAAFAASQHAREKIVQSGSKYMRIDELMQKKPDGSGIQVIG